MNKIKAFFAAAFMATCLFVPVAALAASDVSGSLCAGTQLNASGVNDKTCNVGTDNATSDVQNIVTKVVNIFSWVVGVVSVIMIIVGGFRYIISGGEQKNVTAAKNTILYAIVGLIIVALAQIIVHFVIGNVASGS